MSCTVWESGLFQYDFAGNIIAIGQDAFTYDRLSRLKSATVNRHPHTTFQGGIQPAGFVTLNYGYDLFGNITDRQLAANRNYTVGSDSALELFAGRSYAQSVTAVPDNKIHQAGFRYDGNGNLISDGKKDFIYDELNQQIEVREVTTSCAAAGQGTGSFDSQANAGEGAGATPHGTLCYGQGSLIESNLYGADGMRATRHVEKVAGGVRVATDSVYVRLGGNVVKEYTEELRASTSAAPELSHEKAYVYGPLGLLATEELCNFNCKSDESAGLNVTRYYEYDHLGTIRAITDDKGKLTATFDYEPFGLELKSVGIDWWTDASSNTHRFTGHERDEEAGEDYMKARMYVLSTARFPQIDPVFGGAQDPQNWNAYIYVGNSPVGASDPTGELANSNAEFHAEGVYKGPPTSIFDSNNSFNSVATVGETLLALMRSAGMSEKLISQVMGSMSSQQMSAALTNGFTVLVASNQSGPPGGGGNASALAPAPPPPGTPGSPLQGPPAPLSAFNYGHKLAKDQIPYAFMQGLVANNNLSGLSDNLAMCVIWNESSFNPNLVAQPTKDNPHPTATGLMGITKATAEFVGYDHGKMKDPATNIRAGTTIMMYKVNEAGDVKKGLNNYGTGAKHHYGQRMMNCERCLGGQNSQQDPYDCLYKIHK